MSNRVGGIIGCKNETSSWHFNGFPDGIIVVTLGQQYNIGEKPTFMLYTYTKPCRDTRQNKFGGCSEGLGTF